MSRLLKLWVKQGVLEKQKTGSKKETLYSKHGNTPSFPFIITGSDNKK